MVEEKLTPAEERWAKHYIHAIASLLASGPPSESPEETKKEIEEIEKIALEPGSEIYEKAKKWRRRLIEVLTPV